MKTRYGFVSNSSSSSFIVFGRKCSMDELDNPNAVAIVDGYLGDGADYIEIKGNEDLINTIKGAEYNSDFNQYCDISYYVIDEKHNMEELPFLEIKEHHVGKKLFHVNIDYHSTEDYMEFIRRYTK
jgi:hypothetical protein